MQGADLFSQQFALVGDVGQQSNVTSTLDSIGQPTLMHSTGASGTTGQDLGTLRHEALQLSNILVIDVLHLVDAEGANLTALAAAGALLSVLSHGTNLLLVGSTGHGPDQFKI